MMSTSLLRSGGDASAATDKLLEFCTENQVCHTVRQWISLSATLDDVRDYGAEQAFVNMGRAKHAFVLSLVLLRTVDANGHTFKSAVREVMMLGGDADTNACICGYLMGALRGLHPYQGVSHHTAHKVTGINSNVHTYPRPERLSGHRVKLLLRNVLYL